MLAPLLSGCFIQLGASFTPATRIGVQRSGDPLELVHTQPTVSANFRIGFHFDIAGVGAHYGFFSARSLRAASGVPGTFYPYGGNLKFDVDLPLRFGPDDMFGLRATYAREWFDSINAGGNSIAAHGTGNHAGLTMTALSKDISLSVLVGNYGYASENGVVKNSPNFDVGGWDVDVGLTLRFIPTGTLLDHYVAGPPAPIHAGGSHCGWALAKDGGGFWCE